MRISIKKFGSCLYWFTRIGISSKSIGACFELNSCRSIASFAMILCCFITGMYQCEFMSQAVFLRFIFINFTFLPENLWIAQFVLIHANSTKNISYLCVKHNLHFFHKKIQIVYMIYRS